MAKKNLSEKLIKQIVLGMLEATDLNYIFQTAVTDVQKLLDCDRLMLYRFDEDMGGHIIAESVKPGLQELLGERVVDTYFQAGDAAKYKQGGTLIFDDIDRTSFSQCHLDLMKKFEVKANIIMPIRYQSWEEDVRDYSLWGLLVAHYCRSIHQWQEDEIKLLKDLSLHLSIAIKQAELLQDLTDELAYRKQAEAKLVEANQTLEKEIDRQKLLFEISSRIRQSLDLQSILETATKEIKSFLNCDLVWLACLQGENISIKAISNNDCLKTQLSLHRKIIISRW